MRAAGEGLKAFQTMDAFVARPAVVSTFQSRACGVLRSQKTEDLSVTYHLCPNTGACVADCAVDCPEYPYLNSYDCESERFICVGKSHPCMRLPVKQFACESNNCKGSM